MADSTHNIRIRFDTSGVQPGVAATKAGLQQIEASATRATEKVSKMGGAFTALKAHVTGLTSSVAGFSAAIAAVAAVRTISSFGDQMASVRAVTLATTEDFEKLRNKARELGATTRYTATEAARGLELLARAGADTNGAIALIDSTLRLAQAEELNLAEASDYLAKITQGMRLELSEGARVADVLSATASATATDVRQLGTAMKYAASISSGFKTPIEEVGAALGVLANSGLVADQAGTAVRGLLSRIAAPTKEFVKQLKGVGLTIADINPETNTLIEILEKLAKANITTSEAFQLFKQRAGTGAEILVNNIEKVKALNEVLKASQGVLAKKFEIKSDTLANDLFAALSAVQEFVLVLGDLGVEAILRTALQGIALAIRGIAAAIQFLTPYIQTLAAAFLIINFDIILLAIVGITAAFVRLAISAGIAAAAMLLALSPIALIATGISAAIVLIQQYGLEMRVAGTEAATLGDVFQAVWNRIQSGLSIIATAAGQAFQSILDAGTAVANAVVFVFQKMADGVVAILQGIVNAATSVINSIGELTGLGQMGALNIGKIELPTIEAPAIVKNILAEADVIAQKRIASAQAVADAQAAAAAKQKAALEGASKAVRDHGAAQDGAGKKTKDHNTQISRQSEILDQLYGPHREAAANIRALNTLFQNGQIDASQYNDQLQRMRETMLSQDQTFGGGILRGLNKVAEGATRLGENVEKFVVGAFGKATDAIVNFAKTGKFDFKALISSILEDLLRLATNALFGQLAQGLLGGLGGGLGGGFGGATGGIGGLFGFATGGAFTVGGSGGTDSQAVAFKATPGERVSVATPQQQRAGESPAVSVAPPQVNVRIVNSMDPKGMLDALGSSDGERVINNVIQRNAQTVRRILGVAS